MAGGLERRVDLDEQNSLAAVAGGESEGQSHDALSDAALAGEDEQPFLEERIQEHRVRSLARGRGSEPWAVRSPSDPAKSAIVQGLTMPGALQVRLLGQFRLTVDGRPVDGPTHRAAAVAPRLSAPPCGRAAAAGAPLLHLLAGRLGVERPQQPAAAPPPAAAGRCPTPTATSGPTRTACSGSRTPPSASTSPSSSVRSPRPRRPAGRETRRGAAPAWSGRWTCVRGPCSRAATTTGSDRRGSVSRGGARTPWPRSWACSRSSASTRAPSPVSGTGCNTTPSTRRRTAGSCGSWRSAGDRVAALQAYRQCADALRRELAAEPSAATVRTYERIRGAEPGPPAPSGGREATPAASSLVGRQAEWARLREAWERAVQRTGRLRARDGRRRHRQVAAGGGAADLGPAPGSDRRRRRAPTPRKAGSPSPP